MKDFFIKLLIALLKILLVVWAIPAACIFLVSFITIVMVVCLCVLLAIPLYFFFIWIDDLDFLL